MSTFRQHFSVILLSVSSVRKPYTVDLYQGMILAVHLYEAVLLKDLYFYEVGPAHVAGYIGIGLQVFVRRHGDEKVQKLGLATHGLEPAAEDCPGFYYYVTHQHYPP